jgi:hypothetical protein
MPVLDELDKRIADRWAWAVQVHTAIEFWNGDFPLWVRFVTIGHWGMIPIKVWPRWVYTKEKPPRA